MARPLRRFAAACGAFALFGLPPVACAWVAIRLSDALGAAGALILFLCLLLLWQATLGREGRRWTAWLRDLWLGAAALLVLWPPPADAQARNCLAPDLELNVIEQAHPGARLLWTGFSSDRGVWLEIWAHEAGWVAYGRSATERCPLHHGSGPAVTFGDAVGVTPDQVRRLLAGEGQPPR